MSEPYVILFLDYSRNIENQILANRWKASIISNIYGVGESDSPIAFNNITYDNATYTLQITINETTTPLLIKNWTGQTGTKAQGFKIQEE